MRHSTQVGEALGSHISAANLKTSNYGPVRENEDKASLSLFSGAGGDPRKLESASAWHSLLHGPDPLLSSGQEHCLSLHKGRYRFAASIISNCLLLGPTRRSASERCSKETRPSLGERPRDHGAESGAWLHSPGPILSSEGRGRGLFV